MFDFVVIGFQKCGTDSVRHWLLSHSETVVPNAEVGLGVVTPPWGPGRTTKRDFFSAVISQPGAPEGVAKAGVRLGVVDPTYALCDVAANAEALAQIAPAAKIIAFERPRVDRAHSAWAMAKIAGGDDRSFEEAIGACITQGPSWTERNWLRQSYVEAGEYNRILSIYRQHFAEVVSLPMADFDGLADALGVARTDGGGPFTNRGEYPLTMPDPSVFARLENYYVERGEIGVGV